MKVVHEFRLILTGLEVINVRSASCRLHVWPRAHKHVNTRSGGADDEVAHAQVRGDAVITPGIINDGRRSSSSPTPVGRLSAHTG